MNAFFRSQFSYCTLVWMCHSRTLNNKINRLHESFLRIVSNDKLSSFQNLLDQDRSDSLHTCNLQTLAIEMYKVSKGMAPKIFADIFSCNSRANYDLRYQSEFSRPLVKSVFNGTETISNLGPTIWDLVPLEMKQKESLTAFKKAIKTGNPHNCPCRLQKICCRHRIYFRCSFLGLFNVFLETPYIEGSSHMETSQLTCNASR